MRGFFYILSDLNSMHKKCILYVMNEKFTPYLNKIDDSLSFYMPALKHKISNQENSEWGKRTFGSIYKAIKPEHYSTLVKPTSELITLGGKRWRPLFLVLTSKAVSDTPEATKTAYSLTPLVEFIHTASLIHDDIEDASQERRGKPSAYITYGIDTAINAASWLYFLSETTIDALDVSDSLKVNLYKMSLLELRKLHLGQAMDIKWHREKSFIPQREEYLVMVKCKTGTLASLSAKTGVLSAKGNEKLSEEAGLIAQDIGAAFQIIDDVINLTSGNPGKKRGDDIVEGKKSLPVILFSEKASKKELSALEKCFTKASKEGIESKSVEEAIQLLNSKNSIDEACGLGLNLIKQSLSAYEKLLGSSQYVELIKELFISMIPQALRKGGIL